MANLSVKYMGFEMPSPLILGSCGLTNSIDNLQKAEKAGFGGIVLKSIFEEQILNEISLTYNKFEDFSHTHAYDYIAQYHEMASFEKYLNFIRQATSSVSIPVIASVNCFSSNIWIKYAKAIQDAGAKALEVNYFILPFDFNKKAEDYYKSYFTLIEELKKHLSIPIAIKTSSYFTDLSYFIKQLSYTGINALVLFNRFHSPDINLDKMEFTSTNNLSRPEELPNTLRWVGILSDHLRCDLSATTGCHDSKGLIKLILAGANTVQAASVFYKKGIEYGAVMLNELNGWMEQKGFNNIADFKSKMTYSKLENPDVYARIQFMKYMSGIE